MLAESDTAFKFAVKNTFPGLQYMYTVMFTCTLTYIHMYVWMGFIV